jgi:Site-specific DNA methylase
MRESGTNLVEIIKNELELDYSISVQIINTENYGVPQSRERMIILMTRKDMKKTWKMPNKEAQKVTMEDAIGWISIYRPIR